jgi:RimJ/RimL family protein N-acetyltransferase
MASLMRITPEHGVIEIGNIWLSPRLQQTREATDALFVIMRHALDELGYRRLEWKCDALNARLAARRAQARLYLRGRVPPAHGGQGPQSRHGVVRHPRS